jgi:hypothetical protein
VKKTLVLRRLPFDTTRIRRLLVSKAAETSWTYSIWSGRLAGQLGSKRNSAAL